MLPKVSHECSILGVRNSMGSQRLFKASRVSFWTPLGLPFASLWPPFGLPRVPFGLPFRSFDLPLVPFGLGVGTYFDSFPEFYPFLCSQLTRPRADFAAGTYMNYAYGKVGWDSFWKNM